MIRKISCWMLFFLLITQPLWAVTYTIGPGQTYKTFTALVATETLAPGDIVDGGGNTFSETWTPDGSGTSGNVITLRNATIDGGTTDAAWTGPDVNGEWVSNTSNYEFIFYLTKNGVPVKIGTIGSLSADEFGYVWGTGGRSIYLGFDPTGHTIKFGTGGHGVYINDKDYVNVDNITVQYADWYGSGVQVHDSANNTISNCDFIGTRYAVNFVGATINGIAEYNTGSYCADGLDTNIDVADIPSNITYRYNHMERINYADFFGTGFDGEAYAATKPGNNITITENTGEYVGHFVVLFSGATTTTGHVVSRNKGDYISGQGIYTGGIALGDITVTVNNNVLNELGSTALSNDGDTATVRTSYLNNTISNFNKGVRGYQASYITMKNNIFHTPTGAFEFVDFFAVDNANQLTLANNVYYTTGTKWWKWVATAAKATYAEYLTAGATETGAILTDPLFMSTTDFSLQSTSPAIDAGADVGLTTDFSGTWIPRGAGYDIGAYEYHFGTITLY